MREAERDLLLVLLAICAGSADGWSYFGLGHAFVANMIGNTVLAGVSVLGFEQWPLRQDPGRLLNAAGRTAAQ